MQHKIFTTNSNTNSTRREFLTAAIVLSSFSISCGQRAEPNLKKQQSAPPINGTKEEIAAYINSNTKFEYITSGARFIAGRPLCIFCVDNDHFDMRVQKKQADGIVELARAFNIQKIFLEEPKVQENLEKAIKEARKELPGDWTFTVSLPHRAELEAALPSVKVSGVETQYDLQLDIMAANLVRTDLTSLIEMLAVQDVYIKQNGVLAPPAANILEKSTYLNRRYGADYPRINLDKFAEQLGDSSVLSIQRAKDLLPLVWKTHAWGDNNIVWSRNESAAKEISGQLKNGEIGILLFGRAHAASQATYTPSVQAPGRTVQALLDKNGVNAIVVGLKDPALSASYEALKK